MFNRILHRVVKRTPCINRYQCGRNISSIDKKQENQIDTPEFKDMKNLNATLFHSEISEHSLYDDMMNLDLEFDNTKLTKSLSTQFTSKRMQSDFEQYRTLSCIDNEFYNSMQSMNLNDILNLLKLLHRKKHPSLLHKMKFYKKALAVLETQSEKNTFSTQQKIEYMYFIAMSGSTKAYDLYLLLKQIPNVKSLSLLELCVIAKIVVKTGISLGADYVSCMESALETKAEYLVQNPDSLRLLCRCIRLNSPTANLNLTELNLWLVHHPTRLCLRLIEEMLLLYAKIYMGDQDVLHRLVTDTIAYMHEFNKGDRQNYTALQTANYLDSFLSSISRLGYKLHEKDFNEIFQHIQYVFSPITLDSQRLLRVILYSWILNFQMEALFTDAVKSKIFHSWKTEAWKTRARLQLLVNCVKIECPHIYIPPQLTQCVIHVGYTIPEATQMVYKIIMKLSQRLELNRIEMECPIKGLYIPGITFQHALIGYIHIDILDESTLLKIANEPTGLMQLKTRLLKKLGYHSIHVMKSEFRDLISTSVYIEECITKEIQRH